MKKNAIAREKRDVGALLPVLREKLLNLQTSDNVATPPLSPSPPPPSLYFESSSISSRSSIVEPFDLNVASLYQVFQVKPMLTISSAWKNTYKTYIALVALVNLRVHVQDASASCILMINGMGIFAVSRISMHT
uniref:Uncharacterized protein n=1 Tax=Anopheles atroparvus TaxID=41427 RepID=A0A182JJQ0_ANOAO